MRKNQSSPRHLLIVSSYEDSNVILIQNSSETQDVKVVGNWLIRLYYLLIGFYEYIRLSSRSREDSKLENL